TIDNHLIMSPTIYKPKQIAQNRASACPIFALGLFADLHKDLVAKIPNIKKNIDIEIFMKTI
ncbi:hypothetical protein ACGDLY_025705, partial [Vibrio campbellii]